MYRYCRIFLTHLFSHVGLRGLVVGYAIVGVLTFDSLEARNEITQRSTIQGYRKKCVKDLWKITVTLNVLYRENWTALVASRLEQFENEVVHIVKNESCDGKDGVDREMLWSFSEVLLYCISAITTFIGDVINCTKKAFFDIASNLITETKKEYPTCQDHECSKYLVKPEDCSQVLQNGNNVSGVYVIWPRSRIMWNKSLEVYCDMETDGGGWTVIQRRGKFQTPSDYFYKDWNSYKNGFGDIQAEFWIGNDNIYTISNQGRYHIRFDLKDAYGNSAYAQYSNFWIEDERSNYTLHVDGYEGNAGKSEKLGKKNNTFATKDRPDINGCPEKYMGAWWYHYCTGENLNGLYQPGVDDKRGITWFQWKQRVGLAGVEIKVKPW